MSKRAQWVFLAYRLPRDPSTPRIAVWRRLKALGVAQPLDGLATLPHSARNREQLEWVAEEVVDAGGEASLWIARAATSAQERTLVARMSAGVAEEYRAVTAEAQEAARGDPEFRRRAVRRLRRQMQRIRQRDYFPVSEREEAGRVLNRLAKATAEARA